MIAILLTIRTAIRAGRGAGGDPSAARNPYEPRSIPDHDANGRVIEVPALRQTTGDVSAREATQSWTQRSHLLGRPTASRARTSRRILSEVAKAASGVPSGTLRKSGTTETAKEEIKPTLPGGSEPFATPKPERLLHRIIAIATDPGDIVLDCFLGSGTTAAVAHKMGRRWVGIEREEATVETYAMPRLTKGRRRRGSGGVTELSGWKAAAASVSSTSRRRCSRPTTGLVFLADWMTNGKLAEATAAQLGFEYEATRRSPAGKGAPARRGRRRRKRGCRPDARAAHLADGERVVVCGTGIDTDARPILRELRPGSTLRKIPAALLDEYRSSRQLRLDLRNPTTAQLSADRGGAGRGQRVAMAEPRAL